MLPEPCRALADVLSARAHLTVSATWRRRRLRVPEGVVLHYADVPKREWVWIGDLPLPVKSLRAVAAR
jgi:hypothetical protein